MITSTNETLATLAHVGAALGLAALGLVAIPATADAAATSTRDVIVEDLETELTANPCTGDPYLFARHFDGRVHMVTTHGRTHVNARIKADDATLTPLAPGLPVFTGTEQVHTSETTTSTRATVAFGLKVDVTGPDGQRIRFSEVEHVTFDAEHGTVEFEHPVITSHWGPDQDPQKCMINGDLFGGWRAGGRTGRAGPARSGRGH